MPIFMLELYVFSFIVIIFLDEVNPSLTIYFFGREKPARYYYLLPNTSYFSLNPQAYFSIEYLSLFFFQDRVQLIYTTWIVGYRYGHFQFLR